MTAEENKEKTSKRVSQDQRFKFIGFEVFPGKPKDLFKSDEEKKRLVQRILERRQGRKMLRDDCTLLEERVSGLDRLVLTLAAAVMIVALFLPWYSAYNESIQESSAAEVVDQATPPADSTLLAAAGDSLTLAAPASGTVDSIALTAAAPTETPSQVAGTKTGATEEVLHGYVKKKKVTKEYSRLSGIGSFLALGTVGSYVFSSGFAASVTGILFLVLAILCLLLPLYTLYGLYGVKGNSDEKALKLKKVLRYNWIPLVIFAGSLFLSFFGGEYGFDANAVFTSLGNGYGPGVYLGSLSYGVIVALAASILAAAKGMEI